MTPATRPPYRPRSGGPSSSSARKPATKTFLGMNRAGMFGVAVVGVLAVATFWSPPISRQHEFTTASDYSATRDAGCTNSGEGCHGAEADYADFNDYHPNATCNTCHDYTGVGCIPCHTPSSHECTGCHDGTMEGASDASRLADPYPNGHYRETTHTAMGTAMDREVRSAEEGKAAAACEACHSRDLQKAHTNVPVVAGSPYGETVGCGECHNDVRSNGLAQVLADWEDRSCEACHGVGSSSAMHGAEVAGAVESSGTAGCASTGSGCHDIDNLHTLHPDAPASCSGNAAEGEPGCHDIEIESHAPEARACGGGDSGACHQLYANDRYTHERDRTEHSPGGGAAAAGLYEGVACGACHYMVADGTSLTTEHTLSTSAQTLVADNACRNCHNAPASLRAIENDWSTRDTSFACSTCHDGDGLDAAHAGDLSDLHTITTGSEGCADSGAGCHPESDLSLVGDAPGALHDDCLTCHDRTASGTNLAYDPDATTCGEGRDCHNLPGTYVAEETHGATDGRDGGHEAGGAQASATLVDAASGTSTRCDTCHDMTVGTEHVRPGVSIAAASCTGCHNANDITSGAVKADWPARTCDTCHGSTDLAHPGKESAHTGTELHRTTGLPTPASCAKGGCHETLDLRVLHAAKGCDVAGCHSATGDIRGKRITSCGGPDGSGGCHAGSDKHRNYDTKHLAVERDRITGEPKPESCAHAGCHATTDVRQLHTTSFCYTAGCHVEGGPTLMTCGGPAGTLSCHAGTEKHRNYNDKHVATELDRYGVATPGSCAKAGCHDTVDVRVLHARTSCYGTAGCHMADGPEVMTCGGPDGGAACHTASYRHSNYAAKHQATEIDSSGTAVPGSCAKSGCHPTVDVRTLHVTGSCYGTTGCHTVGGPPETISCGGPAGYAGCHDANARHRVDHSAATTGTVNGITYGPGENEGCLEAGCHAANLVSEHANRLYAGTLEGAAVNYCAICHPHTGDAGNGTYSELTAVKAAIANRDKRCIACHAGGPIDGPVAVASPTAICIPVLPVSTTVADIRMLESVPESAVTVAPAEVPAGDIPAEVPASAEETSAPTASDTPDGVPPSEPTTASAPVESETTADAACPVDPADAGVSSTRSAVALPDLQKVCLTCHTVSK